MTVKCTGCKWLTGALCERLGPRTGLPVGNLAVRERRFCLPVAWAIGSCGKAGRFFEAVEAATEKEMALK